MAYQAVLFDMDGTVLDTLDDLTNAVNASLTHFSLPAVSSSLVRRSLGNGAKYLIDQCVPADTKEAERERILTWYKPWYDAHCLIETHPYPGILPMMERLKAQGLKLAIISNKPDSAVRELAAGFFPGLLETALGESESVRRKPSPDSVLAAAAQMGMNITDCVYVGDSEVDIQTARNAGMDCITVCWGFREPEQLREAGAVMLVSTPEELEERILNK